MVARNSMSFLILAHIDDQSTILSKLDHLMTCCYSQCRNTCKEESEQQLFLELKYFCSVLRIFAVALIYSNSTRSLCDLLQ